MFLVFDIGGSSIKYALLTSDGDISCKGKMPTPLDYETGISDLLESIHNVYCEYKMKSDIEGIAVSLPGQIDVDRGIVYGGGALTYLHKVGLGKLISDRCDGIRTTLENDGKCAALAEVWKGNAKGCKDACVLVFGTGIGAGIIKDGRIHRGKNLTAGEVSYLIEGMTRKQLEDTLGKQATSVEMTWDTFPFWWTSMSSTGGRVYSMRKLKGNMNISGEDIYRMAAEGDAEVQEFLEEWYFDIAKKLCNIQVMFDPEIILLGGGISAQPLFVEGVKKYVDKIKQLAREYSKIKVDVCKYLNDSNLLGAVYNYIQLTDKEI